MGAQEILRTVLIHLRKDLGLTQDLAAMKTGVPKGKISKWETGQQRIEIGETEDYLQCLGVHPPGLFSLCLIEYFRQEVLNSQRWVPGASKPHLTADRGMSGQFIADAADRPQGLHADALHLSMAKHLLEFLKFWIEQQDPPEDPARV